MDAELKERAEGRVGSTINGKYRVEALLGIGGMAAVYKVTHRNRAELAIKMLHPELSVRESFRQRFLREGYAANTVKHPGVAQIVDDDVTEDGAAFLVMELLRGKSVHELAKASGKRIAIPAACAIVDQLLDVLASAHKNGIVHRDIKPANLFLTEDGTLKVLDFGIARVREGATGDTSATGTGVLLGTPGFMAPEQAAGRQDAIGARTDLWAAGATLFTLISGKFVHSGENAAQLMVSAATAMPRSIQAVAEVPQPIGAVVDRALDFDPAMRFSTAAEMQQALRAAVEQAYGAPMARADLALHVTSPQTSMPPPTPLPSGVSAVRTVAPILHTDHSVTSSMMTSAAPPKRSNLGVTLAAIAVLSVVGILGYMRLTARTEASQPVAIPASPQPVVTTTTTTATAPIQTTQIVETPQPRGNVIGGGKKIVPAASQAPGPRVRPQATTLGNCDPPYYFDAENTKIFKKECL
jgi:serine/threonine protein kinase